LGGGGVTGLEILGINMAALLQVERVKKLCRPCDDNRKVSKVLATSVPTSWKLTAQQQAFIDMFAEDEPKKQ
jgi:hypothetical protein